MYGISKHFKRFSSAGAATAYWLGSAGRDVVVVEKEAAPGNEVGIFHPPDALPEEHRHPSSTTGPSSPGKWQATRLPGITSRRGGASDEQIGRTMGHLV